MTTTETEQTYHKLVWAKKPCPNLPGLAVQHDDFCLCKGTRKVPRLPDLSEECYQFHNQSSPDLTMKWQSTCREVGCPGRVPKPMHLETLLGAMRQAGFRWIGTESTWFFFVGIEEPCAIEMLGVDDLPTSIEAAWRAVQARYPQRSRNDQ